MRRRVEAILPDPQNSQCVVEESVTRSLQCLVVIRLDRNEFLPKGLEWRNKSLILTLRK